MMRVRSPTPRNRVRSQRGGGPSLVLDFLLGVLSKALNFSRATNATVTGQDGVLRWAPANQCVNSATPQAGVAMASAAGTDHNITTGVADAFGGFNAIRIEALTGSCRGTTTSTAYLLGQTVTLSFYAKSTTLPFRLFASALATPNQPTAFDLTGEWVRYVATYVLSTANTNWFYPINQGFAGSTTGVGKFVDICGVQLQPGSVATPYVPTTGAAYYGPRFDYDPVTQAPLGLLLEEGRTNRVTYSADTRPPGEGGAGAWVGSNGVSYTGTGLAPDGSVSPTVYTATSANHAQSLLFSVTAGEAYTYSFFAKRGSMTETKYSVFNQSGGGNIVPSTSYYAATASTWKRVSVTFTVPAGCTTVSVYPLRDSGVTGTVELWGHQLELGAFATSYIPTFASAVMRGGERCWMPNAGWIAANGFGTWAASYSIPQPCNGAYPAIFRADNGTGAESVELFVGGNPSNAGAASKVVAGGSNQANAGAGVNLAYGAVFTSATMFSSGNHRMSMGGSAISQIGAGVALPVTPTALGIGGSSFEPVQHARYIRRITYYPTALPDAALQQLSAL